MPVTGVSFGRVIALTGKSRDVNKINRRLKNYINNEKILAYNVTGQYKNQSSNTGSISAAVARGEEAYVYVTRDDVRKVKEKQEGWDSVFNILCNMSQYINLNVTRINKAVDIIV